MKPKTAYHNHNHNLYTLHYSPKLTNFLLADSNVHAITPLNSSPNTSHHSDQQTNEIGSVLRNQGGKNVEYFLSKVENKIKKGVQNFIQTIPASEKMSIKLQQSIETLLLNMLNISKQIKLFRHYSPQSSLHQVSPLAPSHIKFQNPHSHMLIQEGDDLPILSQYPSYEQYESESSSMRSESGICCKKQNKKSIKKGYRDVHKDKQQIKKSSHHLIHQHYAHRSKFDSDSLNSQSQELSNSDKQTQSEIGTQDHLVTTSVLPKSYARSSDYHTSNLKCTPRQLLAHELNLMKQINLEKQAKVQESISEYYLESQTDKENQRPSINIKQFNTDMRGPTIQNVPPQTYIYSQVVSRKKIF